MAQLGLSMILIILPLKMLSGDVTPLESMPEIVQNIMLISATTHFIKFAKLFYIEARDGKLFGRIFY
jgi:ABC-2 type transport system permease protein